MTNEKIPAEINQKEGYIEIKFSVEMPEEAIKKQVSECIEGTCACCTPAFREKVEGFVYLKDNTSSVKIYGSISKEEVMLNVASCAPKLKDTN